MRQKPPNPPHFQVAFILPSFTQSLPAERHISIMTLGLQFATF